MRTVIVMGLIGTLLSLTGCGGGHDRWEGDRSSENPPPKPPNCPSLPELANVTLAGGQVVDIRIIQIDDVKLYVPRSWIELDESANPAGILITPGSAVGRYDPDLHKTECPGVVHRWVSKRDMFDFGFRFVGRRGDEDPWILPNFTLDNKVDKLSIRRPRGLEDPKLTAPDMFKEDIIDWPTSDSTSAHIVVVPHHLVGVYPWPRSKPVGSPEWTRARADVIDLVDWLRILPTRRDNDRIFKLGVER